MVPRLQDGVLTLLATTGNVIASNIIGLNVNGSAKLGNGLDGVLIMDASQTVVGPANVISGNGSAGSGGNGIVLFGSSTTNTLIQSNLIGTDKTGTVAIGNASTVC